MKIKIAQIFVAILSLSSLSAFARDCNGKDVLLEFRAGSFIPTGSDFRDIYGSATVFVSPEFSWQVHERHNWYIFLSAGYAEKKGHSLGLCTPTKARIIPLGIGLKYFFQNMNNSYICKNHKFYVGAGFQPVLLKTTNCSEYVQQNTSNWGIGGVAKIGWMYTFKHNFYLDIFADYSFVNLGCGSNCSVTTGTHYTAPIKADVSGAILGVGFGYSF